MDAYLSEEACQFIDAYSLISTHTNPDGILLGHKRGHRYFVERIFQSAIGFFPSYADLVKLNQIFDEKILGFYSFHVDSEKIQKILSPMTLGFLFLQIDLDKEKNISIQPYVIDYDKDFFLKPIDLKRPENMEIR